MALRRFVLWTSVGVLSLTLATVVLWLTAVPVLVEIEIPPTPRSTFQARASGESGGSTVSALAPWWLDDGYPLVPGDVERTPTEPGKDALKVKTVIGRTWLPWVSHGAARRLLTRPGVRVFSDPLITVAPPTEMGECGERQFAYEDEIRSRLREGVMCGTGEGVLLVVIDKGLHDGALSTTRKVQVKRDLSWPKGSTSALTENDHGTEMAFAATIGAPAATLVDVQVFDTLKQRLSGLVPALDHLLDRVRTGELDGYKGIVLLNAWTMETEHEGGNPDDYRDDPQHPVTKKFAELAANNVDIVFASGNAGVAAPASGAVFGAASLPDVVTVAAVDLGYNLLAMSSPGPGRPTMSKIKPDIAAYSAFSLNSLGGYGPTCGTSAASAIAAGMVAALRSTPGYERSQRTSTEIKDALTDAAHRDVFMDGKPITLQGHDYHFGHGVLACPSNLAVRSLSGDPRNRVDHR